MNGKINEIMLTLKKFAKMDKDQLIELNLQLPKIYKKKSVTMMVEDQELLIDRWIMLGGTRESFFEESRNKAFYKRLGQNRKKTKGYQKIKNIELVLVSKEHNPTKDGLFIARLKGDYTRTEIQKNLIGSELRYQFSTIGVITRVEMFARESQPFNTPIGIYVKKVDKKVEF